MKRTGPSEPHSATPSSITDAIESGKETRSASSQDRQAAVAQITVYSKPASSTARPMLVDSMPAPAQHGPDRREHYTERGPQPSFAFADIDDEQVLKVEAEQRLAMQPVQPARPAQTEQARRLSEIAGVIKKMMEGEVASVLKELARLPVQEGAGQSDLQETKKRFSLFIKHFQQAKLAAGDGKHDQMKEALTPALAELSRFAGQHGDRATRQARASRAFRTEVLPHLQALAAACSTWAEVDDPLSAHVPVNARGDADSHERAGTEARARAVSSPAPVRPSQERERARSVSGQTSSPGKVPAGMADASPATTDRVERMRSPSSPGKKLKAFFSRSSEARSHKARLDSEPGSPPSRSGTKPGTESRTTSAATTTTRSTTPSHADRKPDGDD